MRNYNYLINAGSGLDRSEKIRSLFLISGTVKCVPYTVVLQND
ncbi:MAG: hypothetical protein PUD24_00950 [Oscillospiraceae bacterium]|nr:hypothetical protein [Oscillospiraceae bacterium]